MSNANSLPINAPGGFAPVAALTFADDAGEAVTASRTTPLPVTVQPPAPTAAIEGTITSSARSAAFTGRPGLPIWITLSGGWSGSVQVLRSTDGGATKLPLTVAGQRWAQFTGPANEIVAEDAVPGASSALDADVTGTLQYWIGQ